MPSGVKTKSKAPKPLPNLEMPLASQASSDDGMTVALVQKIHAGIEKKRKEKEAKFLAVYQKEMSETIARSALEFNDYCDQIDQTFDEFTLAYAKAEDNIRGIWLKLVKAHTLVINSNKDQAAVETTQDKKRKDQQVLGIAYHKKSEEILERIISSVLATDTN